MDDTVFVLGRLHCDLADRTGLWRLGALLHSVSGYRQQNWRFDLDQKGKGATRSFKRDHADGQFPKSLETNSFSLSHD